VRVVEGIRECAPESVALLALVGSVAPPERRCPSSGDAAVLSLPGPAEPTRDVVQRSRPRQRAKGVDTGTIAGILADRFEQELSWAMTSPIVGSGS
jgi:hypothetical protein